MCKHEIRDLMGTADGIVCRKCGKLFADMDAVNADRDPAPEAPAAEPEAPKKPARSRKKKGES